jgi:two-component sensor histidine kinase
MALIVAEAVANAIEHGFADRDVGQIVIRACRAHDGTLDLRVMDDGIGLPEDFDLAKSDSLGLKLAQMLARQLGGSFRIFVDGRTTAMLRLT